ncbi:hypothetical protein HM1_0023 [Heliomicrobium modesticaldum Ice1]|uniref:Uncharacterized protein n=1 Tax=Heliobacterium modesticaldum (strain ATCC 51547 / Ice1) TaxID=498761 RepID=B0THX5_HELMI|nr:hypothetical protein HM1_0023 [Heliomicrobium modesticaldum Ice1]
MVITVTGGLQRQFLMISLDALESGLLTESPPQIRNDIVVVSGKTMR